MPQRLKSMFLEMFLEWSNSKGQKAFRVKKTTCTNIIYFTIFAFLAYCVASAAVGITTCNKKLKFSHAEMSWNHCQRPKIQSEKSLVYLQKQFDVCACIVQLLQLGNQIWMSEKLKT